jgi:hypothetical protein
MESERSVIMKLSAAIDRAAGAVRVLAGCGKIDDMPLVPEIASSPHGYTRVKYWHVLRFDAVTSLFVSCPQAAAYGYLS